MELGAVVLHRAHALHDHVAHHPAVDLPDHSVLEPQVVAVARRDGGVDGRGVTGDALAEIADLQAPPETRLSGQTPHEGPLQQVGEERHELFPLGSRPPRPLATEGEDRGLAEVEHRVDVRADGLQLLEWLVLGPGVGEHEVDRRDEVPHPVRRLAGPHPWRARNQHERQGCDDSDVRGAGGREVHQLRRYESADPATKRIPVASEHRGGGASLDVTR
jgi:hypothetical protein